MLKIKFAQEIKISYSGGVKTKPMNTTFLSKSSYIRGLRCHKSLYLNKFYPEVRNSSTDELERRFTNGFEVGTAAQKLFQDGVFIEFEGQSINNQLELTNAAIRNGSKTIYEAAFMYDNAFIKADIINNTSEGWDIYEVKSSTTIEKHYIDDLAFQYYVISKTGLPISRAFLVYINNTYVRQGAVDPKHLFVIADLTSKVQEKQKQLAEQITLMKTMLNGAIPPMDIGEYCTSPYECDFKGYCWRHVPEESVFNIRGKGFNKFELYRNGVIHFKDVPEAELSWHQRLQVKGALNKQNHINREGIAAFLDTLWFPLYFIDFETFDCPIPVFDNSRPYQKIPFQYSIHAFSHMNAPMRHEAFIAQPLVDPREEIARNITQIIPEDACVLAYNQAFEKGVLSRLAEQFPAYRNALQSIVGNVRDLMVPFKKKDVYLWQMNGSYSIKAVLPALVPELSYDGMEIGGGGMAMDAYFRMCASNDSEKIEQIRKALFEYCGLDTLGMVRLLEKLRSMA